MKGKCKKKDIRRTSVEVWRAIVPQAPLGAS
jgi:hypothetical protein